MDLEKLSELLRTERESDTLQDLTQNLEEDIDKYLIVLKTAEDECNDYRELSHIRDELKSAMLIIEGLLERRFAKLVNYAVISVTREHNSISSIKNNDKIVFESLCEQMKQLKNNMQLANCLDVKK